MKKIIVFFCMMLAFSFVSCNHKKENKVEQQNSNTEINSAIIGVWRTENVNSNGNVVRYIDCFAKDGFVYPLKQQISPSGKPIPGKKEKYSFDGKKLVVAEKEKSFRLDENTLVRIDEKGRELEFRRIKMKEEEIKKLFE